MLDENNDSYWWRNKTTLLGMDIGKKSNPSHISIFAIDEDSSRLDNNGIPLEVLIMIGQRFLDNWDYTKQVEYLNACIEYFNIQRGYLDNTRGEMEERKLPRQIIPITLSLRDGPKAKGKVKLATQFSILVEQNRIKLLNNDRFISQILCVTNSLEAPNTPSGHGDSFISVMLAVGVYFDFYAKDRKKGTTFIGNMQDLVNLEKTFASRVPTIRTNTVADRLCKVCGYSQFEILPDGTRKVCQRCGTIWGI